MAWARRAWLLLAIAATAAARAQPRAALETVATLAFPPGNVTVTGEGRVIASAHPSFPSDVSAVILDPSGSRRDVVLREGGALVRVLSVRADTHETVWMLSGNPGQPDKRLYLLDARTGRTLRTIAVGGPATVPSSFLNDIAIDHRHGLLYLSDPADGTHGAIVIVSLRDGTARRVLEGDASVRAGSSPLVIDGKVVGTPQPDGSTRPMLGGVNPITIDAREQWLYYGAFSGITVWRLPTAVLADPARAAALPAAVERYAAKQPSAGISIDDAGRIYATDPGARGMAVVGPAQPYRLLAQDVRRLDWPDGVAVDGHGWVYVCQNGLYRQQPSHRATPGGGPPFYITRFRALGPTTAGR